MREGLSRPWLVLILAAFCVPLFIGLGRTDLDNDEAIYSYAVESILETGDWLSPRSSPNPNIPFLEKPPLKFWIVAAPIRVGVLPPDEFGLRFWDAAFGAIAFVYVFLIGGRLAGPACGAVAVLVLFGHQRLLFDHGLRSNNMEAALFLSYCAGVYHFLRYADLAQPRRSRHLAAVAAFFYLGFMTKFVAALFLPAVLGSAALLVPAYRRQVLADWRRWAVAGTAVLAAIVPWFIYQHVVTDGAVWTIMFGDHVYERFTRYTDPEHLQPWYFYVAEMYRQFQHSGATLLVALGLVVLVADVVRRRTPDGIVVLCWLVMPLALISTGTSKLYHYAYPFLPPLALAAGFGVVWMARAVQPWLDGLPAVAARLPRISSRPARFAVLLFGVAALTLAVVTAAQGQARWEMDGRVLFRNSSVVRPLIVAGVAAAVAGWPLQSLAGALVLALGQFVPLPVTGYLESVKTLTLRRQPLGSLAACLQRVDGVRRAAGERIRGAYGLSMDDDGYLHQYFYYFRQAGGWETRPEPGDPALARALFVPGQERPMVLGGSYYTEALNGQAARGVMPRGVRIRGVVVLLPGAYRECLDAVPRGMY